MDPIRQLLEINAEYTTYREKWVANPDLISADEAELEFGRLAAKYGEALQMVGAKRFSPQASPSERDRVAVELHGLAYTEIGEEEQAAVDLEVASPGSVLTDRSEPMA